MFTLFNYRELYDKADGHLDSMVFLTYSLLFPADKVICRHPKEILPLLNINDVIPDIYKKCIKRLPAGHYRNFRIIDPQAHFKNYNFLMYKVPSSQKIDYLYILSQRRIFEESIFLHKSLVEKKYWVNPFIRIVGDAIHLTMEKQDNVRLG